MRFEVWEPGASVADSLGVGGVGVCSVTGEIRKAEGKAAATDRAASHDP